MVVEMSKNGLSDTIQNRKPERGSIARVKFDLEKVRQFYFEKLKDSLQKMQSKSGSVDNLMFTSADIEMLNIFSVEQFDELLTLIDKIPDSGSVVYIQNKIHNAKLMCIKNNSLSLPKSKKELSPEAKADLTIILKILKAYIGKNEFNSNPFFDKTYVIATLAEYIYLSDTQIYKEISIEITNIIDTISKLKKHQEHHVYTVLQLYPFILKEYRGTLFNKLVSKGLILAKKEDALPPIDLYKKAGLVSDAAVFFRELMRHLGVDDSIIKDRFDRIDFDKTGSYITALTGTPLAGIAKSKLHSLRNRVIIRHIEVGPLTQWVRAYKAKEVWTGLGLDYVPIEPILGIRNNMSNQKRYGHDVDVFAVVLGATINKWYGLADFNNEPVLWEQHILMLKEKIMTGLSILNIEHGHPHDNNFCLLFREDENGKPDISQPPRVYIIDFDQADLV